MGLGGYTEFIEVLSRYIAVTLEGIEPHLLFI